MGGRGASSGSRTLKDGTVLMYGSEYSTVLTVGNIKFVVPNLENTKAPAETMSKCRIYVTIDSKNNPHYISFYDKANKKYKQIDIRGKEHIIDGKPVLPHTHFGYIHDEHGTKVPTAKETAIIDKVLKAWHNRGSK